MLKYFIYFIPLLVLTQVLIIATNILLAVSPFIMGLSIVTILFIVPAVVALGIGLGAAYPDFNSENAAQAITSYGGLIFMMLAAIYITVIIGLEAGPVYRIFMAGIYAQTMTFLQWVWIIGSFTLVALISVLTVIFSMKYGVRRLTRTSRRMK